MTSDDARQPFHRPRPRAHQVRRRQREQALEDRAGDVVEAEEELERVKAGHEAELAALQVCAPWVAKFPPSVSYACAC